MLLYFLPTFAAGTIEMDGSCGNSTVKKIRSYPLMGINIKF